MLGGQGDSRKGAMDAIEKFVLEKDGSMPDRIRNAVIGIAKDGGTPLVVADGSRVLGAIRL